MVVSVFYLDLGDKYVFESNLESIKSNSLVVLTLFYLSSFVCFVFLYKTVYRRSYTESVVIKNWFENFNYISKGTIQLFLVCCVVYISVLLVHLFISGVPLILGFGKGEFWNYARIPSFQILHNQTSTLLFIAGFFYAYYKRSSEMVHDIKTNALFKVVLYVFVIYIILMGYKFGGPLLYLFSFFVTSLILHALLVGFNLKLIVKYVVIFLILVIPIILYVYGVIMGLGDEATQLLFDRVFTLQGQVWHFIYNFVLSGAISVSDNQLVVELTNVFNKSKETLTGMDYTMSHLLPSARLNSYLDNGVRLSGGYPANL